MWTTMNNATVAATPQKKSRADTACGNGVALSDTFKALKAMGFYPIGHPLRTESLRQAHQAMAGILAGGELTLVITRTGFSTAEGGAEVDSNPLAQSLAKELFLRRVQRLTFLTDLSVGDLSAFLALLALEPQKIAAAGGLEKEMAKLGVRTIWANELDVREIWA